MCTRETFSPGGRDLLENLKLQLADTARKAEKFDLCRHKSGNFSVLDKKTGLIAITPSGISREELTPGHIFIVSSSGDIVEKGVTGTPSGELGMHLAAYKCREDITAVAHTHSPYATAFAAKGKPVMPVVCEAMFYGGVTEIVPYCEPCSEKLAESVTEPLQKADVCLLKHHGVLAVGEGLEQVLLKAVYVENTARIYLYSLQIDGREPGYIGGEI